MAAATHATVTTLRRDMSYEAKQLAAFAEMFSRGFGDIPGFVAGVWTFDPQALELVILHLFDSERSAEAFAEMARSNSAFQAAHGLTLVSVRVNEVLGTARSGTAVRCETRGGL